MNSTSDFGPDRCYPPCSRFPALAQGSLEGSWKLALGKKAPCEVNMTADGSVTPGTGLPGRYRPLEKHQHRGAASDRLGRDPCRAETQGRELSRAPPSPMRATVTLGPLIIAEFTICPATVGGHLTPLKASPCRDWAITLSPA